MEQTGIGSRVDHPHFGKGVVVEIASEFYNIWFKSVGVKQVAKDYEPLRILSSGENNEASGVVSLADVEAALETILDRRLQEFQLVPMGGKWEGGSLVMKPSDHTLQAKEVPIDVFFHKIVMVRDRVRLIEQKINAHKGLSDADKVDLQQYISGIYGSLTTFNVLFKETHHQFKGAGGV
ncbi:MAG: hypothetical protein JSS78_09410 [Bacteroidetes bacterium]|nr:hypothetical protein [Bacteroidota bacterium]